MWDQPFDLHIPHDADWSGSTITFKIFDHDGDGENITHDFLGQVHLEGNAIYDALTQSKINDAIYFLLKNKAFKQSFYDVLDDTLNIISLSFFDKIGFVIIPIATSISSWINVFMHYYFIKKRSLHTFDAKFVYKFPRMILSTVVMGIVLYLLLGFFADKFIYNESWKFIYLFIIVTISLISYFLISNFSGAFKFKEIKLKY